MTPSLSTRQRRWDVKRIASKSKEWPATTRAREFLRLHNDVENYLKKVVRSTINKPFEKLVELASESSTAGAAVREVQSSLIAYGKLRNAIVHGNDEIVAEPTEETLQRFKQIVARLLSPPRLLPAFRREIRCFSPADPLAEALRHMRENDFSQVVVRADHGLRLLTVEGITGWLEQAVDGVISMESATVGEALAREEPGSFLLMHGNKTVYDVRDAFRSALTRNVPRLFAVIVTQNGKPTEEPVGLVTPWDLVHRAE